MHVYLFLLVYHIPSVVACCHTFQTLKSLTRKRNAFRVQHAIIHEDTSHDHKYDLCPSLLTNPSQSLFRPSNGFSPGWQQRSGLGAWKLSLIAVIFIVEGVSVILAWWTRTQKSQCAGNVCVLERRNAVTTAIVHMLGTEPASTAPIAQSGGKCDLELMWIMIRNSCYGFYYLPSHFSEEEFTSIGFVVFAFLATEQCGPFPFAAWR